MKIKDYIAVVLKNSPLDTNIKFELNLNSECEVVGGETGNKVSFTVFNEDLKRHVEMDKWLKKLQKQAKKNRGLPQFGDPVYPMKGVSYEG